MSDISAYSAPSTSRPSDQYSHLSKLPQAICQFMLDQPGTAEGVHVSAIARAVGNLADAGKIRYLIMSFKRISLTLIHAARHWIPSWTMVSCTQPLTTPTSNSQVEETWLADFCQITYACAYSPHVYYSFAPDSHRPLALTAPRCLCSRLNKPGRVCLPCDDPVRGIEH